MKNSEHIVKSFGEELDGLVASLKAMKDMVVDLINTAETSLNKNEDLYEQALQKDKKVNELEKDIESRAITLLATRQPMAGDLRFIVSAIKIASLLERIGDRGKKTVKKTQRINQPFPEDILADINKMNKIIIQMINEVFVNIEKYDFSDLKKAFEDDNKVDDYYTETMHKAIEIQQNEPVELEEFIAKIKVLKNFERIGDYATKIAKIVCYIAEGSKSPNF